MRIGQHTFLCHLTHAFLSFLWLNCVFSSFLFEKASQFCSLSLWTCWHGSPPFSLNFYLCIICLEAVLYICAFPVSWETLCATESPSTDNMFELCCCIVGWEAVVQSISLLFLVPLNLLSWFFFFLMEFLVLYCRFRSCFVYCFCSSGFITDFCLQQGLLQQSIFLNGYTYRKRWLTTWTAALWQYQWLTMSTWRNIWWKRTSLLS